MRKLETLLDPEAPADSAEPTSSTPDSEAVDVCRRCEGTGRVRYPQTRYFEAREGPCFACCEPPPPPPEPVCGWCGGGADCEHFEAPDALGIPDRLAGATFENFDLALNRAMKPALERCKLVAAGDAWCALLCGDIGVGKSHLAAAALRASQHPRPGLYWTFGRLLLHVRQQAFDDSGPRWSEEYVLRPLTEGRMLLVLDDVGTEKMTEWAAQTFYTVLNARYEARLPIIVTTNAPGAIDDRVLSRYREGTVSCRGVDIRARARKEEA